MPEVMIVYRFYFEKIGLTDKWWKCFCNLSEEKLEIAKSVIEKNDFSYYEDIIEDKEILELLEYYRIKREDVEKVINKKIVTYT